MSLGTRLSAFFLAALAVVLLGFSGTLYLLARNYLVGQLDDRLGRALDTLEAAIDIEPGGLEWEPADRLIAIGVDKGENALRWAVLTDAGERVDLSPNTPDAGFPDRWATSSPPGPHDVTSFGTVPGWRMARRRLELAELLRRGLGHPDDEPGYERQYPALVLTAGLSPAPTRATLKNLGLTLASLSLGIWALSAFTGRWLVRRALAPLRRMARSAATMSATDLGRLPVVRTGDELEDLGHAFNELLDRLREAFDRLNDVLDRQRRFAGDASHQLCNPLTALLGQVQLASRRERSPAEYREVLARVHAEGKRLRQIVESLLALADPEDRRIELEPIDLATWLPDHLARWSGHPRAADLRVVRDDDEPLVVRAHAPLLSQLIDNLVDNALKYSPPGTPVVVRAHRDGRCVALAVEDRGEGLSPVDRDRIFEPFYRADRGPKAAQDGTGLGLSVARRIAEALAATLHVEEVPRGGNRFVLRLVPDDPANGPAEVIATKARESTSRE